MAHPGVLIPKRWTIRDLLDAIRFPRRKATVLPAVWVDELMQKRFGTLIVCDTCARKYRDGLRRWAYGPHQNMKSQGTPCDFCQAIPVGQTPLWFKEERRYPTATEIAREVWHSAHRHFRDSREIPLKHRLPRRDPRQPVSPRTQVTFAGQRLQ